MKSFISDNYLTARARAKRAEETSNIESSTYEETAHVNLRKRIRHKTPALKIHRKTIHGTAAKTTPISRPRSPSFAGGSSSGRSSLAENCSANFQLPSSSFAGGYQEDRGIYFFLLQITQMPCS